MIQLLLTFLPVYVVFVTVVAALVTTGARRWLVLVGVPLVGTLASWMTLPVSGDDGHMLAVLLLPTGLALYYPILLIAIGTKLLRRRQGPRP